MNAQTLDTIVRLIYLLAAAGFVLGLHQMNSPATARNGNLLSAGGMALAVIATVLLLASGSGGVSSTAWLIIGLGILIGGGLGLYTARTVKMTAMPQLVSLFNAVGGGAAALIAIDDYIRLSSGGDVSELRSLQFTIPTVLDVIIGCVTFTGSLVASGKLQGLIPGKPIVVPGGRIITYGVAAVAAIGALYLFAGNVSVPVLFLIIAGALVGASGAILTKLMANAMNRSVLNIIAGGFGGGEGTVGETAGGSGGSVREVSADDVAIQLAYASKVIVVPGYGLAVAQAQHQVRELAELLESRGVVVEYAIHPVAGRMPGHMNVLLAEASVPYPQLKEMDEINPEFPRADVALVVGANDVTNPAARSNPGSPIYGMPILDVDQAKSVVVIKRSMGRGYAGIDNELYTNPKTGMLFADAKEGLASLVAAVKAV